jgi:hypothetical protein
MCEWTNVEVCVICPFVTFVMKSQHSATSAVVGAPLEVRIRDAQGEVLRVLGQNME